MSPPKLPSPSVPTRASLRQLMARVLKTAACFDAFCVDHFPQVHRDYSPGMSRSQRESLLLQKVSTRQLLEKLNEHYAAEISPHLGDIKYIGDDVTAPPGRQRPSYLQRVGLISLVLLLALGAEVAWLSRRSAPEPSSPLHPALTSSASTPELPKSPNRDLPPLTLQIEATPEIVEAEPMRLSLRANRDSYLLIYSVSAQGQGMLIYPAKPLASPSVRANQLVHWPPEHEPGLISNLTLPGVVNHEYFLIYSFSQREDFLRYRPGYGTQTDRPDAIARQLAELPKDRWAITRYDYVIKPRPD